VQYIPPGITNTRLAAGEDSFAQGHLHDGPGVGSKPRSLEELRNSGRHTSLSGRP